MLLVLSILVFCETVGICGSVPMEDSLLVLLDAVMLLHVDVRMDRFDKEREECIL